MQFCSSKIILQPPECTFTNMRIHNIHTQRTPYLIHIHHDIGPCLQSDCTLLGVFTFIHNTCALLQNWVSHITLTSLLFVLYSHPIHIPPVLLQTSELSNVTRKDPNFQKSVSTVLRAALKLLSIMSQDSYPPSPSVFSLCELILIGQVSCQS